MKNIYLISLFVFSISATAMSQDLHITGSVIDENNEVIAFATTYIIKASDSTLVKASITNNNGYFKIGPVQSGEYLLKVTYVGFQDYLSDKIILNQSLDMGVVNLTTEAEALGEVVVKYEKPIVEVQADKTVFNVDKTINATGSNGFELLRKAPGVIIDNNNSIIVEGKSGVQIYIDGRPALLRGQDLINYLETLQSTDIDSIEIITQPSSRYEAAGNAGIININLKKNKSLGTNGSITAGYIQGRFPRVNSSISLNNRGKKTNLYGTYSNRFGDSYGFINLNRMQNGTRFDARTTSKFGSNNHNLKSGFDYYLNAKNTLGIIFTGNLNNGISKSESRTPIIPSGQNIPSEVLLAQSNADNVSSNYNVNLNYKFADTLGHDLNVDLDYGRYTSDRENFQPNYYVNGTETDTIRSSIARFITPIDIDILAGQLDYEQNGLGGKISAGGRVSYVETANTFNFFDVINGMDVFNTEQSNIFNYTEQINAGYVNYNIKWAKWNLQVGLRVEQTISEGELQSTQQNSNELVKRNYTDYFPSGGLTYQVNRKNSLSLTYSRRIQRPSYQSLNPFQYKIDELSFRQGNPFLQPQYTNNLRLAHTWNYRLTTSLSYSYISDFFAQVTEAVGDNQNFIIQRNVANQRIYNLGVSYPTKINEWWNIYFSLNAFHSEYEATSPDFIPVEQTTLSFYGQNTIKLPSEITMEVSGWFSSPSIWGGTYRTKSLGSLDIAFQKKFFNDRMTARIAFSDILYTIPWRGETQFGDLSIMGDGGSDSRQVRFSLNYNFGRSEIKKARKRKTGIEDEQNRIDN
ncbi:MAG: TonB-dependent receptor family protein [Bacteroidia bacterium]|nr:TonB-dependent receptor family protein [Bacteroidia bacterium]MBT8275382.1 TonB-dependent receptor family protein [Bacteroidia bacterium]NNF30912.1 TonB-dependent receptor [Flavobacteriaceae bacterium]NNM08003.1 TonB-dependent receptor [Flavobacteriaceae bacterium]